MDCVIGHRLIVGCYIIGGLLCWWARSYWLFRFIL